MADSLPISQYLCLYFRLSSSKFFFLNKHLPAQFGVQRHAKVFHCLGMMYGFAIHNYREMVTPFIGEVHMNQQLSSLSLINHCLVHLFISSAALCNLSVASSTSPPTSMMAVSSAKVAILVPSGCRRSLVYIRYKTGPNTRPCCTPALNGLSPEYSSSCLSLK